MAVRERGQKKPNSDLLACGPVRITLIYALVSLLWILLSGRMVEYLAQSVQQVSELEVSKGVLFVVLTSLLLYGLTRRMVARLEKAHDEVAKEQEARFQALKLLEVMTDQTLDAIFAKDMDGRYVLFNRRAGWFVGKECSDVIGQDDYAIFPKENADQIRLSDQNILDQGQVVMLEESLNTPHGIRSVLTIKGPIYDEDRHPTGVFGVSRDMTDQKTSEQALRQSEALYRSLFQNMLGGMAYFELVRVDDRPVDAIFRAVNVNFTTLTGLAGVENRRILEVLPNLPQTDPLLLETLFRVATSGAPERFEMYLQAVKKWLSFSVFSIDCHHFAVLFDDISLRKQAQDRIEFLAFHDFLTGLPNRVLAGDRMQMAAAHADRTQTKAALLFVDLDNFKAINDNVGHQAGDRLLQMVATRLRDSVRDTDTISRHGGDEFLMVLSDLSSVDEAAQVAEKVLHNLMAPFALDDHAMAISASIGITIYPDDGANFDVLMKNADNAMAHAKDIGRNTFHFFDAGLNILSQDHYALHNDLVRAIENNEFELYYQPQIDLESGKVIGAEALIRWNHPNQGLVMPGRFISIAEDRGLIIPMGEWVLRQACRQMAQWHGDGLDGLVVAVNLSALQFKRGHLDRTVAAAVEQSGINPSCLELELTESILIKDVERVLEMLARLKGLGVKLSIDDFGTGYSSLSYLRRFKVDKLKIDQSFVRDLLSDPEDAIIVRTIIQMASALNLRTIAEGVENANTLDQLQLLSCQEAQGYHFARPMKAADFHRYVMESRR